MLIVGVKFHQYTNSIGTSMEAVTRFIALLIALLASAFPAYAYLDPVTGSLVIQGLIALIAGILAGVKSVRARFIAIFYTLLGRKPK